MDVPEKNNVDEPEGNVDEPEDYTTFYRSMLTEQEAIKRKQDLCLQQVSSGMDILEEKAFNIRDILDGQKLDLALVDIEAQRAKGLLDRVNHQTNNLLKGTNDNCKIFCIAILTCIIVAMIVVFFAVR